MINDSSRGWFDWNGERCTMYDIVVKEQPEPVIPVMRSEKITVPGRAGNLTITESDVAYDNVERKVVCYVRDASAVARIGAWLKGRGKLTFANRPDVYHYARVSELITFSTIVRGRAALECEITFDCEPFAYSKYETTIVTTERALNIYGDCTVVSEPTITLTGSGRFDIGINGINLALEDVDGNITIDCEAGIAYTLDENQQMVWAGNCVSLEDGEWPALLPDGYLNQISVGVPTGSTYTQLAVKPNWRYL